MASWDCARTFSFTRFALCEASKYIFYLRYESGPIYKPSSRDFELALHEVSAAEKLRLAAIWNYWEGAGPEEDEETDGGQAAEIHPDHITTT